MRSSGLVFSLTKPSDPGILNKEIRHGHIHRAGEKRHSVCASAFLNLKGEPIWVTGSSPSAANLAAAEKLGIPCYDQEIIEKITEETGMLKSFVESNVEDVQGGWLSVLAGRDYYGHSLQDDLHAVQTRVIRELADKGPCIIIGRCADSILDEYDNVLKVFIHASLEKRAERIVHQYGETTEDPIQRLKDKDKKRKAYYQLYSDRKWGAMENYHVALNSGVLGLERCAEIIVELF